jgi:hypothetical protein
MNAGERLIERGRVEGEVRAFRAAIATALEERSIPCSELGRARIESCADVVALKRWLVRAMTAATEADVFVDPLEV